MARSDLLISLVKAWTTGDRRAFRNATEATIAEERAKHHNILAENLHRLITSNGYGTATAAGGLGSGESGGKGREFISEVIPRRRLDDLILPPVVRRAVEELIEEQHRADVLRAHGLEPRHRVLLVGPPGTGKTSLAEAIAEGVGVPLFVIRYETLIGSYLGETASRLKRVFDYARTSPCVLFFDEFDAVGKERGDTHETGEIKRVVTSLLMQVDDLPSYTILIAATNHPELLDRASWRRFQLRLHLPLPSRQALAKYIDDFCRALPEGLGHSTQVIVRRLGRISYAEAEQFCIDIRRRSVLAMGQKATRAIVAEQLAVWASRATAGKPGKGDIVHGRATATDPADS